MDKGTLYVTRLRLGWSQYQMGKYLGLTRHVVLKIETGVDVGTAKVEKAVPKLEALAEAVRVHGAAAIPKPAPYMRNLVDIRAKVKELSESEVVS